MRSTVWMAMTAISTVVLATVGTSLAGERGPQRQGAGEMGSKVEVYSLQEGRLITTERVVKSEDEWRKQLTREQYDVTRRHGTERAFTGAYWNSKEEGVYRCVACGNELFLSTTKFDSGTGWPSFWEPIHEANIGTREDRTLWMTRTEVHCSRCGAHLGHVFADGPAPTGLRYCINSVALDLQVRDLGRAGE